jgi:hypothetical protein
VYDHLQGSGDTNSEDLMHAQLISHAKKAIRKLHNTGISIVITWVRGHAGHPGNEHVDGRARLSIQGRGSFSNTGVHRGWHQELTNELARQRDDDPEPAAVPRPRANPDGTPPAVDVLTQGMMTNQDPVLLEESIESVYNNAHVYSLDGITPEADLAEANRRRFPTHPDRPPSTRNDLSAIDNIQCSELLGLSFPMIEDIPPELAEKWAVMLVDIWEAYEKAMEARDPVNRDRALKWWVVAHSLMLRKAGKARGGGRRSRDNPHGRLELWINGDFTALIVNRHVVHSQI